MICRFADLQACVLGLIEFQLELQPGDKWVPTNDLPPQRLVLVVS